MLDALTDRHYIPNIEYEQLDFAESVGWLAPGDRAVVKEGKSESNSDTATTYATSLPLLLLLLLPTPLTQ